MDSIPFRIPLEFRSAIGDGSIIRFGTLLKESGTGRILAHVQETGIAQQVLSTVSSSFLSPVSSLANLGSSVYANVQLNHLKKLVEGLQMLQYATLGVAAVGIGVSAIGFALMNRKMNSIQRDIAALSQLVTERFQVLEDRLLNTHFVRILGLFEQADQAHNLKNPASEWRRIAGVLADESAFFCNELGHVLEHKKFDAGLFGNLLRSYSLCNTGRIECLVLANELPASRRVARDTATHYNALFNPLDPSELACKSVYPETSANRSSIHCLRREYSRMQDLVKGIRDAQDAAETKPLLIDTLIERGIDGRRYMKLLREEKTEPIILIPAC